RGRTAQGARPAGRGGRQGRARATRRRTPPGAGRRRTAGRPTDGRARARTGQPRRRTGRRSASTSGGRGKVAEARQADAARGQPAPYGGVAQRRELDLALGGVAGAQLRVDLAGVAVQLGPARADVLVDQAQEVGRGKVLGVTLAAPLAVEPAEAA